MTNGLKFFSPNNSEWTEIKTVFNEDDDKQKNETNKANLNTLLLSYLQMQNVMVLAGSGTSLGETCGPSMKDLWNECTKNGENYTKEAKIIFKKLDYAEDKIEKRDIEDLLSVCEAVIQINSSYEEFISFINHCKEKIIKKCGFEADDAALEAHKTFLHRMSRRRVRDSRLNLFTTNYDTCFETAAGKRGLVIIDGFSFTKPRYYDPNFFDYDIVRRKSSGGDFSNYLEGVFKLYKLHGSVNWERRNESIIENTASGENACIIFPAKGKYQQSYIQPHLELMARYLSALREPNTCLIICGFGFNDDHLSEPIISAISNNPHLKVIVIDINAEDNFNEPTNKHWNRLVEFAKNGENICFINASFKEFANTIPNLHSLTPAEKLAEDIKNLGDENARYR